MLYTFNIIILIFYCQLREGDLWRGDRIMGRYAHAWINSLECRADYASWSLAWLE